MTQERNPKPNNFFNGLITTADCMRDWEPHQTKGFDPNETRMLDILECWTGEEGPAIGLVGIPFDSAVLGRKGAKGGPKKIRDSIRYFKAYNWSLDFWFGDKRVYDFGDIIFDDETVLEAHEKISDTIRKIVERGFVLITLGGDHSIAYPIIKGIKDHYKEYSIGLINIDAHLDVREVINGRITSGTPFRRVLEGQLVEGKNFVEIGIRNFTNARTYRRYVEDKGVSVFTINDIRKDGLSEIINASIDKITDNTDFTYISIDMDSLDQIYAPGVSAPTPDGLTPHQILEIIHQITLRTNIIGIDIVELNPLYDTADTTAINAANFLVQFVSSYYWKLKNK
ncbi:MAG: formimidoylglutamase [Asgard group archaeon]|nr:formimidoylglutamase [Asgard group archaeon]